MFVIVAHTDDCAIVTEGTTAERQGRDEHTGYDETTLRPTVCTCGGVMIQVPEEDSARTGQHSVFTDGGKLFA